MRILGVILMCMPQLVFAQVRTQVFTEGELVYSLPYFKDSSFWVPRYYPSFCYQGSIKKVCSAISHDISEMQTEYRNGAHDYIELKSCQIQGQSVILAYELTDDYSSEVVPKEVVISECK